jgi:hypothetical protein
VKYQASALLAEDAARPIPVGRAPGKRLRTKEEQDRLAAEIERQVAEALRATGDRPVTGRSAADDPRALRGLPMIGGAGGAIPGTLPHHQRWLDGWSGR